YKQSPSGIRNAFGNMMVFEHVADMKVFHSDVVVAVDQFSCFFVGEVFSTSGNMSMQFCQSLLRLVIAIGLLTLAFVPLPAAHLLLRLDESLFCFAKEARVLDRLALIREGSEVGQTQVDTHRLSRDRQRLGFYLAHDEGVPILSLMFD